jgi:hypothetical protein
MTFAGDFDRGAGVLSSQDSIIAISAIPRRNSAT